MNRMVRFALTGLSVGLGALAVAQPAVAHASDAMVSRTYPWTSGRLTVAVPAEVAFHPGPTWRMTITAPAGTLSHLIVDNGRITAESHGCFSLIPLCIGYGTGIRGKVHVALTGPALRAIKVEGAARIRLDQLHQNRLAVQIDGSGSVHGSGSVRDLVVRIDGAASIHLAGMTEQHARVLINGTGRVAIAPTDSVSVDINGAGDVRLHSDPPHVSSEIDGAGEVTRVPSA